ncbi:outer membrane lipoprotein-sorting protein [Ulvibacter antarcticus]|uniref:Outer membrane lipoprotein-sorting protein n=1 Tax=Ulvibacter antarcticus TaxID=442714 RepID=A0A3L9Z257_9FLAO|nr:outer membrane lipoprotein-sorting protein [Ulvibacter antarcticus]RMA64438.1 outer membrane lipoprotein-sorting protein [Ulvibacter antarcticus]
MKKNNLVLIAFLLIGSSSIIAQSADEIIANYFENTGGKANWENLEALEYSGQLNMQGMMIPIIKIDTKSGKTMSRGDFQGQSFFQEVFDGETLWNTNQMTMAAEKSDAESTENFKKNLNDFPDPLLNYKEKGYTAELIGKETIEGTETFKIKLVKEPIMVDGVEADDVSYYYFDTENFVPIVMETEITSGPGKGMTVIAKYSDYQEVDGIFFAFSIKNGVKEMPGETEITIKDIKINPEIEDSIFAFPEKQ